MVEDLSLVRPLGREDRRWLYVAALGWRDRYVAHIYALQDGQHEGKYVAEPIDDVWGPVPPSTRKAASQFCRERAIAHLAAQPDPEPDPDPWPDPEPERRYSACPRPAGESADRWRERLKAEPMRYAGMDDCEILAALGSPLAGPDMDTSAQLRALARDRLHRLLEELGWSFGRYTQDAPPGSDGTPRDVARRYIPPGCRVGETMGAGFARGDRSDASGTEIRIGLDEVAASPRSVPRPRSRRRAERIDGAPAALPEPARTDILDGVQIVITGGFEGLPRPEIAARIKAGGGAVISSVSSRTTHLVAGEKPGSKLAKARALGVPVIGLDELAAMLAPEDP